MLNDFAGKTLLAQGAVRTLAASSVVRLVSCVAIGLLGGWLGGVHGFIVGLAAGALVQHVRDSVVLGRLGIGSARLDLLYSGHLAVVWSVAFGVRYLVFADFDPSEPRSMLIDGVLFVFAGFAYLPVFRIAMKELGWVRRPRLGV